MNLVINSQFRPFTYDEMVKPLVQYKGAYDKVEQDYSDLAAQTEMWKDIVNQTNSPEAYAMYKSYSDRLNSIVDDFSKGMNLRNRSALIGMKRRYASEIKPIEEAYNRRTALAEEQRKAELNNPTMLWQRRASEMSLDDFINNPIADYGKSTSGAALSAQVAAGAGALAKEFRDNPDKMRKLVGGDYFEYVKQRGFSSEAVLAAIANNPDASPVLTNLVESTINSSGIREWGDASTLQQAYNYARQGLWQAIGQSESQIVQNWRAQENLRHSHAMAQQAASQAFQAAENQKNRDAAAARRAPIPIKNKDGNVTGYYRPDIGMVTDKDGNIKQDGDSPISKVGTGPGGREGNPNPGSVVVTSTGSTISQLSAATTLKAVKGLNLEPVMAVAHVGNGYQWGRKGEDLGSGNKRLKFNSAGAPSYVNSNDPRQGYDTMAGESRWLGTTSSNVVGNWGNFTYTPDNGKSLRYISDTMFDALPETTQASLIQAAYDGGIPIGTPFSVYAVEGDSGRGDSYIIFKNN